MYSSLTHAGGARHTRFATLIGAAMDREKWLEQHDRMIADHDRWLAGLQERNERHDRDMLAIREMLRQAVRLSVREARNERAKRRELDEKITQIAAAQLINEEGLKDLKASMQAFLDWMRGGSNGHA
jgi:hypothetical protein